MQQAMVSNGNNISVDTKIGDNSDNGDNGDNGGDISAIGDNNLGCATSAKGNDNRDVDDGIASGGEIVLASKEDDFVNVKGDDTTLNIGGSIGCRGDAAVGVGVGVNDVGVNDSVIGDCAVIDGTFVDGGDNSAAKASACDIVNTDKNTSAGYVSMHAGPIPVDLDKVVLHE